MTRLAVLVGSFALTFALLSVTWMVAIGRPANATAQTPSPQTSAEMATPTASPVLTPTAVPTSEPSQLAASSSPAATASVLGSETRTFVVAGSGFVESQVPDGGSITPSGGGVDIQTTESAPDSLWIAYRPDTSAMPPGMEIISVDTRVCGDADGQFWNIEGPAGSTPAALGSAAPEADGCWHFSHAPGTDLSVIAAVSLQSRLHIDKVEYTVTFVPQGHGKLGGGSA